MKTDQTIISLTKRMQVLLPDGAGNSAPEFAATAAKNLQALGFGLDAQLTDKLRSLGASQIAAWYESVVPVLQEMVGAHRQFSPMYPNFPRQVMRASDAELFFNALTHYYGFHLSDLLGDSNLVVLPRYEKENRSALDEFHTLKWIRLGTQEDFDSIFTALVSSNGSLSEADQETLRWFISNRDVRKLLPERIPQKETLALLVAAMDDKECLRPQVKTATDVLRVAVAMSGGDVSLAEPTKFRSFSKRERRFLLSCLEGAGSTRTEDMLRWKERWVRLGERLHPGDFKKRFPESLAAFDTLRNDLPFQSYASQVERSIIAGERDTTLRLLAQRPGEFARRLDHLLRTFPEPLRVVESFLHVADRVATPVLMQAWGHFRGRQAAGSRAFFPKGNLAKVQLSQTPLPPISSETQRAIADGLRRVLVQRFSRLPPLGKCYLDERLRRQLVPFSQRSASRSLRTVARGSSFDLPPGDTMRFLCWWKNIDSAEELRSRVDLDLSASFFNQRWEHCGDVAYYDLRSMGCFHSGDITSAPAGACEFIDVSLPEVLSKGVRYVVMSVLCYTGQPFTSMPECFGGWMSRQQPNSGEIFEPKTVVDKVDLTAAARANVPVIFDAVERRVIWTDLALKSRSQINNAARNSVGFSQIGQAITQINKPTLFELFEMHVEARGVRTQTPDEAQTIFGLHSGTVTPFDVDVILGQFMA